MRKFLLFSIACGFLSPVCAQPGDSILLPQHNDAYSEFVKQLESGNRAIDYAAFRNSFIRSRQFMIKGERSRVFDSLGMVLHAQLNNANYNAVIRLCNRMLSIDYTHMMAHKYLQQAYHLLGDTAAKRKHREVVSGLLNSILASGDGKSCSTAWEVMQIEEEYFVLGIFGARLVSQRIDENGNNICDAMKVKTEDGKKATWYFGVSKIFSTYSSK